MLLKVNAGLFYLNEVLNSSQVFVCNIMRGLRDKASKQQASDLSWIKCMHAPYDYVHHAPLPPLICDG